MLLLSVTIMRILMYGSNVLIMVNCDIDDLLNIAVVYAFAISVDGSVIVSPIILVI